MNNGKDIELNKNHTLIDCEDCLMLTDDGQCRAYEDRENPITDEEGFCIGKVVRIEDYIRLAKETGMPYTVHHPDDCKNCLLYINEECKVYDDNEEPLLNKNGKCLGRITKMKELKQLIDDTNWEYFRRKLKRDMPLFEEKLRNS